LSRNPFERAFDMKIPETLERPYGTIRLVTVHFTFAVYETPAGDRKLVFDLYPQDVETPEGNL
jgi:hypothetical protein